MAIKPTDLVLWIPDEDPAKIDSPDTAKRALGWVAGEKPAFQTMNYLQNNWGQWLAYFEIVTDDFEARITVNETDVNLNNIHRVGDGSDHFDVDLNNFHRNSDGKDHSDVILNNTHRVSDGKDHSDVISNTGDITTLNAIWTVFNIAAVDIVPSSGSWSQFSARFRYFISGNKKFMNFRIDGTLSDDPAIKLVWDINADIPAIGTLNTMLVAVTYKSTTDTQIAAFVEGVGNNLEFKLSAGVNIPIGAVTFTGSFSWD